MVATKTLDRAIDDALAHGHQVFDDFSNTFHRFRGQLADAHGRNYLDFVRSLKPHYGIVLRDIALGYFSLMFSAAAIVGLSSVGVPAIVTIGVGALLFGYWIAYLQLFIHEGAHFNLAEDRGHSDMLCNTLIGWMVGTSVQKYRVVHFQHHRALGTVHDSEFTYFFPLNTLFLFKSLTGIRALEVIMSRNRYVSTRDEREAERRTPGAVHAGPSRTRTDWIVFLGGIVAHLLILTGLWLIGGGIGPALAWVFGVGVVFPFFGALRQLLEHRDQMADQNIEYAKTDHGAYTRMFGTDVLSATFGGAGFNRHLLHHWEPQISYTRLADLEAFLLETEMKRVINARRSGYGETFLRLLCL